MTRRHAQTVITRLATSLLVAAMALTLGPTTASGDSNEATAGYIPAQAISVGGSLSCVLLDAGRPTCWGLNGDGGLGLGDTDTRGDQPGEMGENLPTVPLRSSRSALSISTGNSHACSLLDDHTVVCWGTGGSGRLGYGDATNRGDQPGEMGNNLPPIDLGTGRTALSVSAGGFHTCAVLDNGALKCWGNGAGGRLGNGDIVPVGDQPGEMGDNLPPVDLGTGRTARAVSAGNSHTCALLDDDSVKCWGDNSHGQLGQGEHVPRGDLPGEMGDNLPPIDLGAGRTARAISAGRNHTCALLDNGSLKCWGLNSNGQLGQGDTNSRGDVPGEMGDNLPPIDLGTGRSALSVSSGTSHTCALLDTFAVRCWGGSAAGTLGLGDTVTRGDGPGEMGDDLPPVDLGTGRRASAVAVGEAHSCALLDDGTVKCWGGGSNGRLGYGDTTNRGDAPGQMGDDLPTVDLSGLVGRAAVKITMTANRTSVIAGAAITYTVTVRNTGTIPLTGTTIDAPDTPNCARTLPTIAAQATVGYTCVYTTTSIDAPQMSTQAFLTTGQGATHQSARIRTRVDPRTQRADAQIRPGTSTFLGDNTYNTTGTDQTATSTTKKKKAVRYTWRTQNDGNITDTFILRGTKRTKKFTVTYKLGATNITTAVTAGTFTTTNLTPGATTDITVTVTPTKKAKKADSLTLTLTARSVATSSVTDTVRAVTTRR